jgi:2-aminoethylphosphonate-pyruvate transaminase
MTSESVRHAAAILDMNHRDPAFLELQREVKERLRTIYQGMSDWVVYLIGGSGTAAMEAMASSCIESGQVLVLENGYYSSRMREILEVHSIEHQCLSFDWLSAIDLNLVDKTLAEGQFRAVLVTHNETTTGRLNPVERIGELAHKHGAVCLVDAISSFGADSLDCRFLDGVVGSANKCLHGIAGVSFVLVKPYLAAQIRGYKRRTVYLHLPMYEGERPPLTPPIPALSALRQALRERPKDRGQGYLKKASLIRSRLKKLGYGFAIPEEEFSCTMTVASIPAGYSWPEWFDWNRSNGYLLYECKGDLRERFFQVANMGELSLEQIQGWLDTLQPQKK